MSPPKPEVGYNIQMTKVTDLGGGHETVTINTAVGPDASEQAIYDKIHKMGGALQRRIAARADAEVRRQEAEKARLRVPPALATPEHLPDPPPVPNGHDAGI